MKFKFKLLEDNRKFKLYTNGSETIRVYENEKIPDGFVPGVHYRHEPWNKGLTAETDARVKDNADKAHATRNSQYHEPWNKGLTKETDSRVKGLSGEDNPMYGKHPTAWNKGLTKETDDRMKKASDNHKGVTAWNKGLQTGFKWTPEMEQKRYNTMMQNGTLGKNIDTKAECEYYSYLKTLFDEDDIVHPYIDKDRYPFKCDFYIKSLDKFIEIHGNWTHGGRAYDPNDPDCQKQLEYWKEKAKTSNYYKNAIYTWTDLDVRKKEIAEKNNLNFEVIYYKY